MDTDKLRSILNQRLKDRHYSQRSASIAANLHPNTLNNIMQLRRVPDPETLRKLAGLLDLDEDELMELAGHRSPKLEDSEVPPKLRMWFHRLRDNGVSISEQTQNLVAFILRQEFEAAPAARTRPQVLAAAGDSADLNLPENQQLLDEIASEEAD